MLITTTNNIEGKKIMQYKGIVCGEVITGVNFLKDFMAGIRDLVGGRSQGYEEELIRARNEAIDEMMDRAASLGCNAIVGVDIDYEVLGQGGGMLMVTASGTGVITE
ncbi:YbjQ family protein [Clostridium sporogenes]